MRKIFILSLIISLFNSYTIFSQTKVGDAILPNTIQFDEQLLILNGAGIREKLWFDLYACGLYLPKKSSNPLNIVTFNELMGIKLHILSSLVSKKKLIDAFRKGIDETNNLSDVSRLSSKIDVFLSLIKSNISVNNVYDLIYFPNKGLVVFENNKELGVVEGLDFKKLVFNIWLAPESVDNDLKRDLIN